jgi:hypothetical protein
MKRDMELVRKILIAIEDYDQPNRPVRMTSLLTDYPENQVDYNTKLLYDSGLIDGIERRPNTGTYILVTALTWSGHEFLDAIRNDTVWHKVTQTVEEKGGSMPFEIIQGLALAAAKSLFGIE